MTPPARVQAAIEIVDGIIAAARENGAPADRIIVEWFRTRRFAGSSDRRAVRELVFAAIRACGEIPPSGRAAMLLLARGDPALGALFDGSRHAPFAIVADEPIAAPGLAPAWLEGALAQSGVAGPDAQALLARAPLDVRVNTLKADRASLTMTGALPLPGAPTAAPQGLRFPPGTAVEQWDAWRDGLMEVQDTGSQLACLALSAQPGETIVDLCAGGGGKTLALAAGLANRGALIACDTDRRRLSRLAPRAARAGAHVSETILLDPGREIAALTGWAERTDAVLVDAPCSGTGTWRRNPEARWRLTAALLARHVAAQRRLLDIAASCVAPGGRLIYAVCSLLDAEGPHQIAEFLARHVGWGAEVPTLPAGTARGPGVRLSPWQDGTDGFFIARLRRL